MTTESLKVRGWGPTIGLVVSIVGLALMLGIVHPVGQAQTVADAKEIKTELVARVSREEDERKRDRESNTIEHKEMLNAIKDVSDRTYKMQIRILERFDSIGVAPSGMAYRRGRVDE